MAILFLLLFSTPIAAQTPAPRVTPKVDLRIELLSIAARLAGFPEYSGTDFESYAADIQRHFAPYRQHPAIQFLSGMRKKRGVGYDAVMSMAVHLTPPPALSPQVAFSDTVPDKRWGKKDADAFAGLIARFYADSHAASFFAEHAELYRTAEQRFQTLMNRVDISWYQRFYGEAPEGTFKVRMNSGK